DGIRDFHVTGVQTCALPISGLPRLPAAELESAVLDLLRAILRAPNLLGDMLPQAIKLDPTLDEAKITVAMTRLDAIWDQLFPARSEERRVGKECRAGRSPDE